MRVCARVPINRVPDAVQQGHLCGGCHATYHPLQARLAQGDRGSSRELHEGWCSLLPHFSCSLPVLGTLQRLLTEMSLLSFLLLFLPLPSRVSLRVKLVVSRLGRFVFLPFQGPLPGKPIEWQPPLTTRDNRVRIMLWDTPQVKWGYDFLPQMALHMRGAWTSLQARDCQKTCRNPPGRNPVVTFVCSRLCGKHRLGFGTAQSRARSSGGPS